MFAKKKRKKKKIVTEKFTGIFNLEVILKGTYNNNCY